MPPLPRGFGVRVAQVGISALLPGGLICARTLLAAPRSSSSSKVHQNDIAGHIPTTDTRCLLRPPPRWEDFTGGKKATHTACLPRGQSLLRIHQSNHPASGESHGSLPSTFRDWGIIVTMMFPEHSLPVRRVTYRILLCSLDNPGRNGLLLSSHFTDEETEAGKVKLPHS